MSRTQSIETRTTRMAVEAPQPGRLARPSKSTNHGRLCGVNSDMNDCGCWRHTELQQVQSTLAMEHDRMLDRFDIIFLRGQWPLSLLAAATEVTVAWWYGESDTPRRSAAMVDRGNELSDDSQMQRVECVD